MVSVVLGGKLEVEVHPCEPHRNAYRVGRTFLAAETCLMIFVTDCLQLARASKACAQTKSDGTTVYACT